MKTPSELRAEATRLLKLANRIEKLPTEDPFGDGETLTFEKVAGSSRGGRKLYFAAVRAGGSWYVTGEYSPQAVSWGRLVDFIGEAALDTLARVVVRDAVVR